MTWKTHADQVKVFGNSWKSSQRLNNISSELAEQGSDTDWFNLNFSKGGVENLTESPA